MPNEASDSGSTEEQSEGATSERRRCGMIRPIADMDGYPAIHWREVHEIVSDPVNDAGYDLKVVSESDGAGVINAEIVKNLYYNDLVIADVSGKNPNVMFELGLRAAFQMPLIIIADDTTKFSFDIAPVRHIIYPRTLRFGMINDFKIELAKAIRYALDPKNRDEEHGYLRQFGEIKVSGLGVQNLDANQMAEKLFELQRSVSQLSGKLDEISISNPITGVVSSIRSGRTPIVGVQSKSYAATIQREQMVVECDRENEQPVMNALLSSTLVVSADRHLKGSDTLVIVSHPKGLAFTDDAKSRLVAGVKRADPDASVRFEYYLPA